MARRIAARLAKMNQPGINPYPYRKPNRARQNTNSVLLTYSSVSHHAERHFLLKKQKSWLKKMRNYSF